MAQRYTTQPGTGGEWHIYPGGRRVFVKKSHQVGTAQQTGAGLGPLGAKPPGFGPGAAGVPAATTPPAGKTPPPDAGYEQQISALGSTQAQTVAGLGTQRDVGLKDYGFAEGAVDPTKGYGALTFDPNNPFSKAALLKRNYDTQRRATGLGMAAGGGLYAGAFQSGQDAINRGQIQGEDALQQSLIRFLSGNTADVATAGTNYQTGAAQAEADRIGRIPNNPLYTPTPPAAKKKKGGKKK